jgi:hypothetical protein
MLPSLLPSRPTSKFRARFQCTLLAVVGFVAREIVQTDSGKSLLRPVIFGRFLVSPDALRHLIFVVAASIGRAKSQCTSESGQADSSDTAGGALS